MEQEDEDDEEVGGMRVAKRGKRTWEEDSEDDAEARKEREEEEEREKDQREKEEFAERLRLKDEEKTRKIMEAKVSKEQMQVTPPPRDPQ
jgi:pre-mRNA-splicing factor ATP-dependent RNA helicase DHX16